MLRTMVSDLYVSSKPGVSTKTTELLLVGLVAWMVQISNVWDRNPWPMVWLPWWVAAWMNCIIMCHQNSIKWLVESNFTVLFPALVGPIMLDDVWLNACQKIRGMNILHDQPFFSGLLTMCGCHFEEFKENVKNVHQESYKNRGSNEQERWHEAKSMMAHLATCEDVDVDWCSEMPCCQPRGFHYYSTLCGQPWQLPDTREQWVAECNL